MNEGVCQRSLTSDFSHGCMNENFEIPLKVIGHETLFSGGKHSKFGMEFQYKNRGFDLKKNFEIEPSLGMGITSGQYGSAPQCQRGPI